jgi:predicted ribosome quality control (RQC) complex YloA/Tae2 family protein
MSDNIERFIRDNREGFDTHIPSAKNWSAIENEIGKAKAPAHIFSINILRWSAAAAIFIGLLATGLYIYNQPSVSSNGSLAQDPVVEQIDPQYAKMVAQFSSLIEEKQTELKSLEKDNPELFKQFAGDIKKLDSTYQVLRNTLPANPNKEQLLEAMISNLQMQISLLNQQLQIIQQVKRPKTEKI